jgi:hypothetical protein
MMTALKSVAAQPRAQFAEIRPAYLEALRLVERLHRRLLDVIKDEFDRRGRSDAVQALLLYNISDKELTRNWSKPAICIMPARASTAAPCESV